MAHIEDIEELGFRFMAYGAACKGSRWVYEGCIRGMSQKNPPTIPNMDRHNPLVVPAYP